MSASEWVWQAVVDLGDGIDRTVDGMSVADPDATADSLIPSITADMRRDWHAPVTIRRFTATRRA